MKLIGFSGVMGAGKDTAFTYLANNYRGIHKLKVADPLQDIVAVICDIYEEDGSHKYYFEDRFWKENHPALVIDNEIYTVRRLMQILGNGLRQVIHPHFYNAMLDNALDKIPNQCLAIVTDIRYPDDHKWIKDRKGINVYIYNPVAELALEERYSGKELPVSEQYLSYLRDNADVIINNDNLTDTDEGWMNLYSQLDSLYRSVMS